METHLTVRHELTQQERADRAESMSDLLAEVTELEKAKKDASDEFGTKIKEKLLSLHTIGAEVRSGYRNETHEVDWTRDEERGVMIAFDVDTREKVYEREMTEEERQHELELADAEVAPDEE